MIMRLNLFRYASFGNGLMGAVAGIFAQVLADKFGNIGPFQAAIALTAIGMVIIAVLWGENTARCTSVIIDYPSLY